MMPAADYSKKERGDGRGRAVASSKKKATAIPGGGGCWIGGPQTESSPKYQAGLTYGAGHTDGEIDEASGKILAAGSGTSIFDPVLCELAYRWFCPPRGLVLDPFAGGSVRGIVAAKLGRRYIGVDLRAEQIEANKEQAQAIVPDALPTWYVGDSLNIAYIAPGEYDFVFSRPPYGDLEVYSDNLADLSNMSWEGFCSAYTKIVVASCALLKQDRFACFVVGDIRSPDGAYRNLPAWTTLAFEEAGLRLWNEAVLVTAVGSLPIRAARPFVANRKLGKTHQNVLVYLKGDARKAVAACGDIEVAWPDDGLVAEPPPEE